MLHLSLRNVIAALALAAVSVSFTSCSDSDNDNEGPNRPNGGGDSSEEFSSSVMFVLNEGQFGMNNASIDMLDLVDNVYSQDVYLAANPSAVLELGDTGNDLTVAGDKLYAVINGSHKVEVIDADDCKRLGKIDVNSPRYAVADNGYLYVSSYMGGDNNQGSVVKIDLAKNQIESTLGVGIHPEEMAISGGRLYVTSSQDYSTGEYDNRLYVVNLATFTVEGTIVAGLNQTQIKAADNGKLYVVTAGNYADVPSNIYEVNPADGSVTPLNVTATKLAVYRNTGYVLSTTYDANWVPTTNISCVDLNTLILTDLTLEKMSQIETPYAMAVDPEEGTLYVGDACDYMSRGRVYAYDPATGALLGVYNAGVIPGHFAFYRK